MPRLLPVLLAVASALALAACGEREEPGETATGTTERIDLVLDFFPNADHAGIYAAIGDGAFERVGLEVTPRTPSDPSAPLKLLAAGRADLAISYEPEVLLARDRGLDVMAIGALVQEPLTSIISVGDDKVTRPSDLEGKTVGTAGIPYQEAYLDAILDEAGVDPQSVRRIDVGFNLTQSMLSGRVDATLGSFWNYEGTELERRDRNPSIIRVEDAGVPTYDELVVVAREGDVRERGPLLRRFMQALARGHEALRRDADTGLDPLLEANPDLDRGLQRAVVRKTLPAFFPSQAGRPFGFQDPREWDAYAKWMNRNGLLERTTGAARAFTNEFLPGEGV